MRLHREIPLPFARYLDYLNGKKQSLPAGAHRDAEERPLVCLPRISPSEWQKQLDATRQLFKRLAALAPKGRAAVDALINTRGGFNFRIFIDPAAPMARPDFVPAARRAEEIRYAFAVAMWGFRITAHETAIQRLGVCQHCGRLFFRKTRAPSQFCGRGCRQEDWNARRTAKPTNRQKIEDGKFREYYARRAKRRKVKARRGSRK
jgi:hypothetical protein